MGLPQNEAPMVQIATNQPHRPLPISNTNSLVEDQTDLTRNNGISSGFSNFYIGVLAKNRPKDTVLAAEPIKRPANTPHGPESNRKQRLKRWCLSLFVANESRFDEGYDSDGQIGPFFGALDAEGDQLFEESPLVMPPTNTSNAADATDKQARKKIETIVL